MRDPATPLRSGLLLLVALGAAIAHAGEGSAQIIRGRVIDEPRRSPLSDVVLSIQDSTGTEVARARTNGDGFFEFGTRTTGTITLAVDHPGYTALRRAIRVTGSDMTVDAIVLVPLVVELDPVEAQVRRADSARTDLATEGSFRRASHVIAGARIAELERRGVNLYSAIREINGVRVTDERMRSACVESRRRTISPEAMRGSCFGIVVVVDGIVIGHANTGLGSFTLQDLECIEYLPPAEAGQRYGLEASARGALVLWRRDIGPCRSADRNR